MKPAKAKTNAARAKAKTVKRSTKAPKRKKR